jgi:hypothetical protein
MTLRVSCFHIRSPFSTLLVYMKPLACRALLNVVILAFFALVPGFAQTVTPPPVEVATVRFSRVRGDVGNWYMTEIELQPRAGVGSDNRMYLDRVKVTLNLGVFSTKSPAGAVIPDSYYRAAAEAVSLKTTGGRAVFRFYLPPEIVDRDQITGDLKYYLVELFVDGKALPLAKNQFPVGTFAKPEIVESFRAKVASQAGANDGILLPQYLTPFAKDGSPPAPSCIRLETAR